MPSRNNPPELSPIQVIDLGFAAQANFFIGLGNLDEAQRCAEAIAEASLMLRTRRKVLNIRKAVLSMQGVA